MKFKTIALIFNIVLFLTFLFIFFIPMMILDGFFLKEFWFNNFWVLLLIVLFAFLVNLFLFKKKTIMKLLESEDWPALQTYLEVQIYEKRKITRQNIKIYVEASVLLSDFENVNKLKEFLEKEDSKKIADSALLLGLGDLLQRKFSEAAVFYDSMCDVVKRASHEKSGLLFFSAYSWLKSGDSLETQQKVSQRLLELLAQNQISVYTGIAAYILKSTAWKLSEKDVETLKSKSEAAVSLIKKTMSRSRWENLANTEMREIYGLLLKKLIADSENLIFNS